MLMESLLPNERACATINGISFKDHIELVKREYEEDKERIRAEKVHYLFF